MFIKFGLLWLLINKNKNKNIKIKIVSLDIAHVVYSVNRQTAGSPTTDQWYCL